MAKTRRVFAVALFCIRAYAQPPTLQLSKSELVFSGYAGGDPPSPASIVVTSSNQAPVRFTVATDAPARVLSFTPSAATTPARIAVAVDPSNLAPGAYQSRILITDPANNAYGPTVVPVTFTVEARPPVLDVSPNVARFAARPQSDDDDVTLFVRNAGGGGRLPFSVSLQSESPWIASVSPAQGFAGPNAPFPVRVRVSPQSVKPGAYRAVLRFTSPAGSQDVPVSLFVSPPGPALFLNPRGIQFEVRQGAGTALKRQIAVINRGSESLDWTADLLQGDDWLRISDTSGTSSLGDPGTITIATDDAKLRAGTYYGLLRVSSPAAQNSPQLLPIVLNVLEPAVKPRVGLSPGGLVFVAVADQAPPSPQSLQIYASSTQPVAYQYSGYTADGSGWLRLGGNSGASSSARAGQTAIAVNHANLQPGIYHGEIAYSFSSADIRAANVTLVVLPPGAKLSAAQRAAVGCTPTRLAMTQSSLTANFSAPVGWPTPLTIQLSDDCGSPVTNGQIVLSYSNGDPPQLMTLTNPQDGSYSATWIPTRDSADVSITARGVSAGLPAISAQISGAAPANKVPVLFQDGTVDSFSLSSGAPLAPGTMAALLGSDLASADRVTGVNPLPTEVDGTRVLVGGVEAPIHSVSGGRILAQIPAELDPNRLYQVLVSVNGALTVPDVIALTAVQPALQAAPPDSILTAQHADFTPITSASPARPGEDIVVYVQGMGQTAPPAHTGSAAPLDSPAKAVIQPVVTIDGKQAEVVFAGLSPGSVGLHQINLFVPADLRSGNLEVIVVQGSVASNPGILPVQE